MGADHHHHHAPGPGEGDGRVLWAVAVNLGLTLAQVAGGVISGSLALIADALHNFSDAAALGIAFAARRIARRPADPAMTYGYGRAEIVAALVNYTTLVLLGLYLLGEAAMRVADPQPVAGWTVVLVAGIALAVDLATVALTRALSRRSMNIRAAFLHNLADALGSLAVIVSGVLIILYDWRLIDPAVTLLIAGYVLWHAGSEIGAAIRILMLGAPEGMDTGALIADLRAVPGVEGVHHVHLWALDEREGALEAHVVVPDGTTGADAAALRRRIREMLAARHGLRHATLEIETASDQCPEAGRRIIGHAPAGAPEA